MKVLALCDSVLQAARFQSGLSGLSGVELDFLVCNNSGRPGFLFLLAQLRNLLRGRMAALSTFLSGRLRLELRPVNDQALVSYIQRTGYEVGLHGMGVIYRADVIDAFSRGILNAHIGSLPRYRGRSVMEWSILHGRDTGITTFFIDAGIDTGSPIVRWEAVRPATAASIDDAKKSLFDQDVRQYRLALEAIAEDPDCGVINDLENGRRYFVMSALFRSVVAEKLHSMVASTEGSGG
jgi:folate-dependent phosphoribosylglycinamide formyltransferase PurN